MKIGQGGAAPAAAPARDIEVGASGGLTLRGRWWPRPDPRGTLVLAHGFGEHGGTFRRVAESLGPALGIDVVAVDFRGHGRSPGRRGVVRRYDELTDDLHRVLEWTAHRHPDLPRFLLGHSNGGQVALRSALADPAAVDGLIVSNPALRIALPIPPHKLKLGRFLLRHAPWVTLNSPMRVHLLTRDPEIQREHRADRLRHHRMSAPLFFGMVDGGEMLLARAAEIRVPILLIVGGQDPVVDPAAARELYDRLGGDDKTLLLYPKMLHEPLNELGREQVLDDVARWIEPRLNR
ncbi:MAG: alpha/beta hydrolase [Isosphaeraceae bacterium]